MKQRSPSSSSIQDTEYENAPRSIRFKLTILLSLCFILFLYYRFYPFLEPYFSLQCPFVRLTSWSCPLCGSQRALHALLNLQFKAAFEYHPLLLPLLCFMFLFVGSELFRNYNRGINRLYQILSHRWLFPVWILLFLIHTAYQNLR